MPPGQVEMIETNVAWEEFQVCQSPHKSDAYIPPVSRVLTLIIAALIDTAHNWWMIPAKPLHA